MANPQEIRKKIMARKADKVAAQRAKYAQMRQVADDDPGSVEKDLTQLADACAAQAEAFDNLRENLDLIQPPKEASLKIRVAAARSYAKKFRLIAEEHPEQLADAISQAYHSLDEQAGALENLADHLGITIDATPVEEAFAEEGRQELDEADESGVPVGDAGEPPFADADEKEAGSEGFVTDRDESGQPRAMDKIDVPRVAAGESGFVTDRDKDAKPSSMKRVEIPQSPGSSEQNKSSRQRPRTQIVSGGTPSAIPAAEFVKNIPQAEGQGQTPGNKSSSKVTPARSAAARGRL